MSNSAQEFVSTTQAAELLGVSHSRIRALIKYGRLEAQKIGRNYIVAKESVISFKRKPFYGRKSVDQSSPSSE